MTSLKSAADLHFLHRFQDNKLEVTFLWIPAHVGTGRDEIVDTLAKQTLKLLGIHLQIPLSCMEVKAFIKVQMQKSWQKYSDYTYAVYKNGLVEEDLGVRTGGKKES